jgi:hypothetical protein
MNVCMCVCTDVCMNVYMFGYNTSRKRAHTYRYILSTWPERPAKDGMLARKTLRSAWLSRVFDAGDDVWNVSMQ